MIHKQEIHIIKWVTPPLEAMPELDPHGQPHRRSTAHLVPIPTATLGIMIEAQIFIEIQMEQFVLAKAPFEDVID